MPMAAFSMRVLFAVTGNHQMTHQQMLDSFLGVHFRFRGVATVAPAFTRALMFTAVCCPRNSSAKESPHWPTFGKHAMTVSTADPTEHRFNCMQLDPPSSHRATSQCTLSLRPRKDGGSAPWKNTSRLPVWAKPDVSFCYIKIKLTDKKANVLADKREAYSEDALSRVWSFLEFAPVNARRIFKPRSKWLWGIVVDNKGKQGFDVKVGSLLSLLLRVETHQRCNEINTKSAVRTV